MWNEVISYATHGGYYDSQAAASTLLREMETDCASRSAEEANALIPIIERARLYLSRMGAAMGVALQNNRRKFMDAWYDYGVVSGFALA